MRASRLLLPLLMVLLPATGTAQDRFASATRIGTVDSVRSAVLNETRPYLVYTPPSYNDTTLSPQRYPVLYLLDGDAHFHSVSGLVQILATGVNGTFVVPEMIVIAIPNTNRSRDLTPTKATTGPNGQPASGVGATGGMPDFFRFIQTELMPHVESHYRTMPYRVFVGHSLGGITTINALYTIPSAFNAYVAIDPSLWWDNQVLFRKAKDYFSTARLEGKALYIGQANTINPDDTTSNKHFESIIQFDAILRSYNRSGLRYAYKYYGSDDHGSVPLITEYDALRFIFQDYKVPLLASIQHPELLTDHFARISRELGADFMPPEGMLRLLTSVALQRDSTKAIELGEMRTGLYPESYRAWEALGDLWSKRDVQKARGYYEQSLTRNAPKRVRDKLARLGSTER